MRNHCYHVCLCGIGLLMVCAVRVTLGQVVEPARVAVAPPPVIAAPPPTVTIDDLQRRLEAVESELAATKQAATTERTKISDRFTLVPFGRIHADMVSVSQDADSKALFGDIPNGILIRRARLGLQGEGYEIFAYKFDVDFVTFDASTGTRPTIFDAYFDVKMLPVLGLLRVGHFREPFSLERLDASSDLAFTERSTPVNTFAPFRNMGIMSHNVSDAKDMTFALGFFSENTNEYGSDLGDQGGEAITSRLTYLPWYDEPAGGRYLLHVGLSYSGRNPNVKTRRFAITPEVRTTTFPAFVDTGTFAAHSQHILGLEMTSVAGPWSLQSEYLCTFVDQTTLPNLFFQGAYVQGSVFLTGEHRNYNRDQAIYGAVTPLTNFFRVRTPNGVGTGWGAWEAAVRWSWIDLNHRNIRGGELHDASAALNWYLAPRTRVMFTYVHSLLDRSNRYSQADTFDTRLQVNF